jgi:hypothetical protein
VPKHQALHHLRLEADRATAEKSGQDFRHWLAAHPLDVIDRPEIDSKPTSFDNLFVVKSDRH